MPEDLPHHVRGDLPQVADQAEMALAELRWMVGRGVAGLDRHRDHARAGAPRGRDQHLRFEHEALAGYVVERIHRAWIQALAALAVDQAETAAPGDAPRSEEHTSELQSLMRISYAVFCLKKKKQKHT